MQNMGNSTNLTLPNLFSESIFKFKDKTSLVFAGEENYTYEELGTDVNLMCDYLMGIGIQKGDKVAILSANMPNWGVAFFAIQLSGAIAVPILPDFHTNEIATILDHSEAKVLIVSKALYNKGIANLPKACSQIILLDNFANIPLNTPIEDLDSFASSKPISSANLNRPQVDEEDIASIIYTSGTTGNSKGVMLSQKNLAWTTQQCYHLQKIDTSDKFISMLPLSHTLENTVGFLLPVKYGASIHYLRKLPTPPVLMEALAKVKPTIVLSVPLIIEKIFRLKILPKFQGSFPMRLLYSVPFFRKKLHKVAGNKLMQSFGGNVRFFGIGGAKLDEMVERFLHESNFPYAIGYGLTETSPLLAGAVVNNTRIGSTGPAVEGVQLRIADKDPVTGEGEIQAKGPNVMKGYYKAQDLTDAVFTEDGWFKTGDRGWLDKDNFLYIKGRIKTMIVGASGENIFPEDIESVINKMRFVLESMVVQKKGKLVAMIHLNMEEIENQFKSMQQEAKQYVNDKIDEILNDIHKKVNEELNKFSRLQAVVLQPVPFEKTPTKKIKRFLYH